MKSYMHVLAAAAIVAGSPVMADSQVIASPGVSLTEAAQAKFNRDTRPDDGHVKPVAGNSEISPQLYAAAGLTPAEAQGWTIDQVFVAKINRESGGDQQQAQWIDVSQTSGSRAYGQSPDYSQLARSAGLTRDEAAEMSLSEIAAAKLNAEH
jgi:hypothetical protein